MQLTELLIPQGWRLGTWSALPSPTKSPTFPEKRDSLVGSAGSWSLLNPRLCAHPHQGCVACRAFHIFPPDIMTLEMLLLRKPCVSAIMWRGPRRVNHSLRMETDVNMALYDEVSS